ESMAILHFTSGTTGMPKGAVHVHMAVVHHYMSAKYALDMHEDDVFWCTADVGWVTGHSYIVYGPLANGATTVMFEGVPTYPDAGRFWAVCEKHKVNQFYTAPTAIRALMGQGDEFVTKYDLSDLRILGTVGEPINPEAWRWYNEVIGKGRCPIVDTWWQTETGGHLITPLPGAIPTKPGSATKPFFGVQPVVLNDKGEEISGNPAEGVLAIADSWPGQMRTVYGDHDRFVSTYFEMFKGYYFSGDGCRRDEDGYYWITGRVDDVINVSGHRMGTAEVESALVSHPSVSEAAVVGYPHDVKGQGIYCYVTLMAGYEPSDELLKELQAHVRKEIGPIAKPDVIQWAPGLPKTRSGKIMRRILRKIAENETGSARVEVSPSAPVS
ncbi:MAG: AMP-binding protein, partial [Pseudomonadota bacterium]